MASSYDGTKHIAPRRRLTRQRSGFGVDGEHSGNECRVISTQRFAGRGRLEMSAVVGGLALVPLFSEDLGMVAGGLFIRSQDDAILTATLKATTPKGSFRQSSSLKLPADKWTKLGVHLEIPLEGAEILDADTEFVLTVEAAEAGSQVIFEVFGLNLDAVTFYEGHPELRAPFLEKTSLYLPEIYYIDHDEALHVDIDYSDDASTSDGTPLVVKACNRCERYLPIDLEDERNPLSFSNHCVKRAPCTHESFARYEIQNEEDAKNLLAQEPMATYVVRRGTERRVNTHHGFQLECRVCKKFFVNMPLNPLRSATQHREDSLRRRAVEDLLVGLLGHQWIYQGYRLQTGREFDVHVWDHFGRKCFRCGDLLPTPNAMALDHTMPLAYLWPLSENATCLCPTCNSQKHDLFPFEFYNPDELRRLSAMTGIPLERLASSSKQVNARAVDQLRAKIDWFFDCFLAGDDYQKVRDGKLTADLVCASLQRVLDECATGLNLVRAYRSKTGGLPSTITLE